MKIFMDTVSIKFNLTFTFDLNNQILIIIVQCVFGVKNYFFNKNIQLLFYAIIITFESF